VTEALELGDEASGLALGVAFAVVVAAEVAVRLAGGEHVPVGDEHRVLDGNERAAVPAPWSEPLVLGLGVAVVGAGRGQGGFFERDPQPFGALAGVARAAFAGGLVVAGAAASPRGEVSGGGEQAHVGADLSDHHLGAAFGDAGDRGGELDAWRERAELLLDRFGEPVDVLIEEVEVLESL